MIHFQPDIPNEADFRREPLFRGECRKEGPWSQRALRSHTFAPEHPSRAPPPPRLGSPRRPGPDHPRGRDGGEDPRAQRRTHLLHGVCAPGHRRSPLQVGPQLRSAYNGGRMPEICHQARHGVSHCCSTHTMCVGFDQTHGTLRYTSNGTLT